MKYIWMIETIKDDIKVFANLDHAKEYIIEQCHNQGHRHIEFKLIEDTKDWEIYVGSGPNRSHKIGWINKEEITYSGTEPTKLVI